MGTQLSPPEVALLDPSMTDSNGHIGTVYPNNEFVANAAGSTTTLKGEAADLDEGTNCIHTGHMFVLTDSDGKLKEQTIFTVTGHDIADTVSTVTFSPAAAAATASGDKAALATFSPYVSNGLMDVVLKAKGYDPDKMTSNDKVYAIRLALSFA